MIDRKALKEILEPYKRKDIARKMGITEQAFINKISGRTSFWVEEADKLKQILNVPQETIDKIFFA